MNARGRRPAERLLAPPGPLLDKEWFSPLVKFLEMIRNGLVFFLFSLGNYRFFFTNNHFIFILLLIEVEYTAKLQVIIDNA